MITLRESIVITSRLQRLDREDLIGGIRNNKGYQIKSGNAIPLIDDLEI